MRLVPPLLALLLAPLLGGTASAQSPEKLADTYASEIEKVNAKHARKPGQRREADLAADLPKKAHSALEKLLEEDSPPEVLEALLAAGEAALELDLVGDFTRIRARMLELHPEVDPLGTVVSRERFLARGLGGLSEEWLTSFADVTERLLDAYDEVFGFEEWSKVPGKKLRIRVHLEEEIASPPHFAPQFPFHSEIDFPVADASAFRSPTGDGKFLFYGLCHELGHVIAMWGDRSNEEDHHAWAHYTGVTIVEHLGALDGLKDVNWRSLTVERETHADVEPSTDDKAGVMSLLIRLHDELGPRKIGAAINHLDRLDRRARINHVRYYTFKELEKGLLEACESRDERKLVGEILD